MATERPLTIVCCHAVFTGTRHEDPFDEKNWILKPFQKGDPSVGKAGEHTVFIQHLRHAVRCWQQNPRGILIFSGGATERPAWQGTEARGYLNVLDMLYPGIVGRDRILLEELATDTYQNMLLSLLLYHKHCGEWPASFSIVTHAFKRRRILDIHARALKWASSHIKFHGIDPPFSAEERAFVERAEQKCCEAWEKDIYGVRPPLRQKRIERCLDDAATQRLSDDGDVKGLLSWDGGCEASALYPGLLPWEAIFEEPRTA